MSQKPQQKSQPRLKSKIANQFIEASLVYVGRVGRPHGIKGAFCVEDRGNAPVPYKSVFVESDGNLHQWKIVQSKASSSSPIIKVAEMDDRDSAERYRGAKLFVESSQIKIDPEREFLWSDVLGRRVLFGKSFVGEVIDIYETPGGIVVTLSAETKEVDLPFHPDYFAMDFVPDAQEIFLAMDPEVFSDLWRNVKSPRKPR